jgi:hypothetical protein
MKLTTHFLPSAEFNSEWSYTSNPPYGFMVWYLVTHRDKFTSTSPNIADTLAEGQLQL